MSTLQLNENASESFIFLLYKHILLSQLTFNSCCQSANINIQNFVCVFETCFDINNIKMGMKTAMFRSIDDLKYQ